MFSFDDVIMIEQEDKGYDLCDGTDVGAFSLIFISIEPTVLEDYVAKQSFSCIDNL